MIKTFSELHNNDRKRAWNSKIDLKVKHACCSSTVHCVLLSRSKIHFINPPGSLFIGKIFSQTCQKSTANTYLSISLRVSRSSFIHVQRPLSSQASARSEIKSTQEETFGKGEPEDRNLRVHFVETYLSVLLNSQHAE